MITGELKNKVDKIWEVFWTGGITNPLEVIEQFTYLLFIRQLDDVETTKENEAGFLGLEYQGMFPPDCQEYRWSRFKNLGDAQEIYDIVLNGVFPFIKNLHQDGDSAYSKYMGDAIFKVPTPAMLTKLIDGIDSLELGDSDSKGDLYEYLLSKVATAGTNGQFRTPRHIIRMMVELVRPNAGDSICEEEFTKRIQRKKPEIGDIVYTREGAIIDRECNVSLGQRSMLLSPNKNRCTSEFLCVAMNCDSFLDNALKGVAGSASPHINVGDIKAFNMIMPPIELQKQFTVFVHQIDKLRFATQKSLDETQQLFDSLMQKYFG